MSRRQYVLGGVLLIVATLAAVILRDVLATIFLALTVAFLLAPLRRRLRHRGWSPLAATLTVTAAAVGGVLALFAPLGYLLFVRFSEVVTLIETLPESFVFEFAGLSYELLVADVVAAGERSLVGLAGSIAAGLPVLVVKLALFILLVFSMLYNEHNIRTGVISIVPPAYRDIVDALHTRARETLYALYILQAATAFGTFLIALPVFFVFGYSSPVILATVAGILQFVPIVGPSVLIAALVIGHVIAGEVASAVLIAVVGGGLIAWLPDLAIRPRLASKTADLDGSLYFIGFVGGLLSLGAIGIIVGPLVVALLVEATTLLTTEFEHPGELSGDDPVKQGDSNDIAEQAGSQ